MSTDKSGSRRVHQKVPFRFIHMECCGHLLCWVNPRFPSYCPACGGACYPQVKGWVTASDEGAILKTELQIPSGLSRLEGTALTNNTGGYRIPAKTAKTKKKLYGYSYPHPTNGEVIEGRTMAYSKLSVRQALYSRLEGKVTHDQIHIERLWNDDESTPGP